MEPTNQKKSDINISPSWSEFRKICENIETLTQVPFRIVDSQNRLIHQSRMPLNQQSNTILTMHCRHRQKTCFRILCEVKEKEARKVLGLMFILKKIGLDYQRSKERNERLYQEINRDYQFLHFFYTLPELLSENASRDQLCQILLDQLCKVLKVDRGSIFLFNSKSRRFQLTALHGKELSHPELARMNNKILEWVQARNRPLLIEDVNRNPSFQGKGEYRTRSFISSPIYYHPSKKLKSMAGMINLADPVGRSHFSSHELKFISSVGGIAVFLAMTKPTQ